MPGSGSDAWRETPPACKGGHGAAGSKWSRATCSDRTRSPKLGEALDFWRVEAIEPGRLLRLRAEMKVPGSAWLQFEVKSQDHDKKPLLAQTAFFAPKGLLGLIYWYGLYPMHALIFRGMIHRLAARAEQLASNAAAGRTAQNFDETRGG